MISADLLMMLLESLELLDHHPAGWEGIGVLVWEIARQENLGKARIRIRHLARIRGGGNYEFMNHFSGVLDTPGWDAAAMSIAEQEAAGFRKHPRVGGVRPHTQEEKQASCDRKS
jgi:hypothetical protein